MGRLRRLAPAVGLLGLLAFAFAFALAASAEPAQSTGATAKAIAVRVTAAGQAGAVTGTVSAPPDAVAFGDGFVYPADGSIVSTGSVTASASVVTDTIANARVSTDVSSISIFNGEITIDAVAMRAKAAASVEAAGADFTGSAVTNIVALGTPIAAAANARFPLADWGYIVTLEQASAPAATEGGRGHSASVAAVVVRLTADHGGLPAGSEIVIGYGQVSAEAKPPPPAVTVTGPRPPKTQAPPKPTVRAPPEKRAPDPGRPLFGGQAPVKTPPKVNAKLTPGRYVFPVYGPAAYSDTWGAPRAITGTHQGTDIFAPLGAPVLAVTDGTVYSVGWNDVGGNRLWLRDNRGNEYYYAHNSAFSPLAVNGAIVKAGDVLAFIGTTGDAQGTPPHVHFEIHPWQLLKFGYDEGAINSYPYLNAWQRVLDLRFPAFATGFASSVSAAANVPAPGAVLLSVTDISRADGLEPGALEAAINDYAAGEGDGSFVGRTPSAPRTVSGRAP